ncbi:HDOD domain-containing protein [Gammaproteobacteria bacterium AS21]|jgi:HD-like signal output (HDOD) protein
MEIKDLLAQSNKLPNISAIIKEIIESINDPDASYGDIAHKIAQDQTLSLKVLRLVNSAYFGLSRKVDSIDEAVVMLGMGKLKTLVVASGFANSAKDVEGMDLAEFWADVFQVAEIAKWLAQISTTNISADLAFTAGIIHNIGQLLLHMAQPNKALAIKTLVDSSPISRVEAEQERLGFTSADAGAALLEMWHFPKTLADAVKYQHCPNDATASKQLSAIINLACFISKESKNNDEIASICQRLPQDIAQLAGISSNPEEYIADALAIKSDLPDLAA